MQHCGSDINVTLAASAAYLELNMPSSALEAAVRAAQIAPDSKGALDGEANALMGLSQYGAAAAVLEQAVRLSPESGVAYSQLGYARLKQAAKARKTDEGESQLQRATAMLNLASSLLPNGTADHCTTLIRLGAASYAVKSYSQALEHYVSALRGCKDESMARQIYVPMADTLLAVNDSSWDVVLQEVLSRALEVDPFQTRFQTELRRLLALKLKGKGSGGTRMPQMHVDPEQLKPDYSSLNT